MPSITLNSGTFDYENLADAVSAAESADTIHITTVDMPNGGYVGSAHIDKSLTIVGEDQPILVAPDDTSGTSGAVLWISGDVAVNIANISITGAEDVDSGFVAGIWISQGVLNLSGCDVTDIHSGAGHAGVGINVTNAEAHLDNVTVSGYQTFGIFIGGGGTIAEITDCTVTGLGATSTFIQQGIRVQDGAVATITGSTISNNVYDGEDLSSGPDWFDDTQAIGISLDGTLAGNVITDNTITNNDVGIAHCVVSANTNAGATLIRGNTLTDNLYYGIALDTGIAKVKCNTISGGMYGIGVFAGVSATQDSVGLIGGNTISDTSEDDTTIDDCADNADALLANNTAPTVSDNETPPEVLRNYCSVTVDLSELAADEDEDVLEFSIAADPTHGTLYRIDTNLWIYISDSDYVGEDSFDFQAKDGAADSDPATFTLEVVNEAPSAEDTEVYNLLMNKTLIISDLATYGSSFSSQTLTPSKVDGPSHGTLIDLENGEFEYMPDEDYVGDDSFTFVLNDGIDDSEVVTASITVVDDELVANDVHKPIVGDDPVLISPEEMWASAVSELSSPSWEVTSVGSPDLGTLTSNGDGTWTYTPPGDRQTPFDGEDTFGFTISDGVNLATANFTVFTPVRDSPEWYEIRRADHMRGRTQLFPDGLDLDGYNAKDAAQKTEYDNRLLSGVEQGYRNGDSAVGSLIVSQIRHRTAAVNLGMMGEWVNEDDEVIGYWVRLWRLQGGSFVEVIVDVPIPTARDFMRYGCTADGSLWYTVLEMAYDQQFRQTQPLLNFTTIGQFVQPVANAERTRVVLTQLFGVDAQSLVLAQSFPLDAALIARLSNAQTVMATSTFATFDATQQGLATARGIDASHTYAVIGYEALSGRVILRNPHNRLGVGGGEIYLELFEYRILFQTLNIDSIS